MAISTMWIKNNMLFPPCEQYERQLTEAELKVQRSLLKLSIPDWYLNKRSNPPKILNNVVPIESRPPSWKCCEFKKNSKFVSASPNLSDTFTCVESTANIRNNGTDKGTYKVSTRRKSTEAKCKNSPSKSSPSTSPSKLPSTSPLTSPSPTNEQVFDTTIPKIKLSTNISRTFPKMSPPRKIQNINIVFPPGPTIDVSSDIRRDTVTKHSKHADSVSKKQSIDADEKKKETGEQGSLRSAEMVNAMSPARTSHAALILEERKTKFETQSPRTRFLYSRKKSTELENVVRSGQSAVRKNTVVQSIIKTLKEKVNKSSSPLPSSSRQNEIIGIDQNFVKKLIDALEKGEVLDVEVSMMTKKGEDTGIGSDSEGESCRTTTSPQDTDSNSDSDHRFTEFRSDETNLTFDSQGSTTRKSFEEDGKIDENDDGVYWIPVSRCEMPRTSSMLSMMSKLPGSGQSPCVSPIRRTSKPVAWG